jgi:hypothetical protein
LDIAQNSVTAGAKNIGLAVIADTQKDILRVKISDDGCGMDKELLERASDPFATTRKTRKVGLGLPFYRMAAESAGGGFNIESEVGKGTVVTASFQIGHIDRTPLGDLGETVLALITGSPQIEFVFEYGIDGRNFIMDTREIKAQTQDAPLDAPEIVEFLREYLHENIEDINKGIIL